MISFILFFFFFLGGGGLYFIYLLTLKYQTTVLTLRLIMEPFFVGLCRPSRHQHTCPGVEAIIKNICMLNSAEHEI